MLPLIKLLLIKSVYDKYHIHIYNLLKNNKDLVSLYTYISKLQNTYYKDITIEELTLYVLCNCFDKDKEKYAQILQDINTVDTSTIIIDDILKDVLLKEKAYHIATTALEVSEGLKSFSDLLALTENLNATTDFVDTLETDSFITTDLDELYHTTINKPGLRWRLNSLNRSLGSLRKGDFGFIFARPETGKTTFLTSEISFFAEQCDNVILWFNNEEQGNKVQLRVFQASLGINLTQLFSTRDKHKNEYIKRTKDNIKIIDGAIIKKSDVERLIVRYNPACIIFDQLDKVQGFSADREDLKLGSIYIWARELAKKYCPVIGVCQSDATGEGKRWLTMDNVSNAKTAKQAEADWILGIGKTHNEAEEYQRYLSICKNKLMGDEDTDPLLRHGRLTVNIIPEIARYKD